MSDHEEIFELFREKKSCSKAILQYYGKGYGIESETLDSIASALEGGLGIGGSCGALVAAFIILGLRCGTAHGGLDGNVTSEVQDMAKAMAEKFTEEFGSILCRELVDFDVASPSVKDSNTRIEAHMKHRMNICGRYVAFVADMLDETVVNVG